MFEIRFRIKFSIRSINTNKPKLEYVILLNLCTAMMIQLRLMFELLRRT